MPNPNPEIVGFRELIESSDFQNARAALPIVLGKDLEGKPVIADLAKMPHLLIAGATGSGKSVCVNTIITSLVYRHTPKTLRFLMVDPKMVELSVYNTLPHLRHKVITDNRDAAAVLKWAVMEMQERYELLAANGCRNLQDFNRRVQDAVPLKTPRRKDVAFEDTVYRGGILPYIVVVIDEMADLMMTVQGEVETPIAMLAQKARAIGIHLILATQRPSVNVITGLIKANFPSRIAFRVAGQVDSRTIIDGAGAEMLLGNGDMLFIPPGKSEASRLQGAYLSSEETEKLMGWYEAQRDRRRAALAEAGARVRGGDDAGRAGHSRDGSHARSGGARRAGRRRRGRGRSGRRARPAVPRGRGALHPEPERLDVAAAAPARHRLRARGARDRSVGRCRRTRSEERPEGARSARWPRGSRSDLRGARVECVASGSLVLVVSHCGATPFAGAQIPVPTQPPTPVPISLTPVVVDSLPVFERPNGALMRPGSLSYVLSLTKGDGQVIPLGTRTVTVSDATLGGTPGWLVAEARLGTAVESTDSVYLTRADLAPERWSATIGRAQLGASFSRDSVFGAIETYQGRSSFAMAVPPGALLSAGMVERLIELLPLHVGYRASASLLLIDGASPRYLPAEIVVGSRVGASTLGARFARA